MESSDNRTMVNNAIRQACLYGAGLTISGIINEMKRQNTVFCFPVALPNSTLNEAQEQQIRQHVNVAINRRAGEFATQICNTIEGHVRGISGVVSAPRPVLAPLIAYGPLAASAPLAVSTPSEISAPLGAAATPAVSTPFEVSAPLAAEASLAVSTPSEISAPLAAAASLEAPTPIPVSRTVLRLPMASLSKNTSPPLSPPAADHPTREKTLNGSWTLSGGFVDRGEGKERFRFWNCSDGTRRVMNREEMAAAERRTEEQKKNGDSSTKGVRKINKRKRQPTCNSANRAKIARTQAEAEAPTNAQALTNAQTNAMAQAEVDAQVPTNAPAIQNAQSQSHANAQELANTAVPTNSQTPVDDELHGQHATVQHEPQAEVEFSLEMLEQCINYEPQPEATVESSIELFDCYINRGTEPQADAISSLELEFGTESETVVSSHTYDEFVLSDSATVACDFTEEEPYKAEPLNELTPSAGSDSEDGGFPSGKVPEESDVSEMLSYLEAQTVTSRTGVASNGNEGYINLGSWENYVVEY